jgi:glycosyltransferase involved in cell wall biosynthesis
VRLLSRITDAELLYEMNAAQIHLCPSRAEGWGHYITEGLSVGALVIATDGSPMNEHVRPEHGILVRPATTDAPLRRRHQSLGNLARSDSGGVADPGTREGGAAGRQRLRHARRADRA